MDRQGYFKRPTLVKEIIGENTVIYPKPEKLAETLESLRPGISVILEYPLDGSAEGYPLVPGGYAGPYNSAVNFLKRGPLLKLRQPRTFAEAVEGRIGLTRLRIDAFDAAAERFRMSGKFEAFSGYYWFGLRDNKARVVWLHNLAEATHLRRFSADAKSLEDKIEVNATTYHPKSKEELLRIGATFVVGVPVRSGEGKHEFKFASIPYPVAGEKGYGVEMNVNTEGHGSCKGKLFDDLTFRFRQQPLVFDAHEIAAYWAISEKIWRETNKGDKGENILQPFGLPTELTYRVWHNAVHRVMVEEVNLDKKGRRKRTLRPLDEAEISVILAQLIQMHGHKATFFSRKHPKDYRVG